ncbi:hypothetical protein BDP27DRAFT_1360438 [Rhodocollybia butyracea]|uniref:Uncharacterized protein n=1 Tax=Rhodocollybia butyracea TaxID=206335 RepID=A0A9P5Q331_9AGAR|nr:hypothetical protein BDP27DRAFT_1360438 [Rhodocollybia butyracea]
MPFTKKRRLSDAGYRASGSVRKKLRHRSPSPLPIPATSSPAGTDRGNNSDSDTPTLDIPISSAPASPQFDNDDPDTPIPLLNLQPLPDITPTTPRHAQVSPGQPTTPMSVLLNTPAHLRGRPRVRRAHHNPLANADLYAPIQWEDRQAELEMRKATAHASQAFNTNLEARQEATEAQDIFRAVIRHR